MNLIQKMDIEPAVVFLTGLSGSGKSTLAASLQQALNAKGIQPVLLDGDTIRSSIRFAAFDENSRKLHNLYVGWTASLFEKHGHVVIIALIAPYRETRARIREMCRNFVEVHLSASLEVCIQRDTKGLYDKALRGELQEFTGISAPYETPENPEITLDTGTETVEACTTAILKMLVP